MTAVENIQTEFKMSCVNCGHNNWINVDEHRLKKAGMHICAECSFISYPAKWATYEEIKKHYRDDYRKAPTSSNFYTGQRKLYFHQFFLKDLFKEWESKNFNSPQIFEVGAAYGLVLHWLKSEYPDSKVSGTEWGRAYKRVSKHINGIDLVDDFDDTKKHDLIISYKVAEHQLDVDKELRRYATSLTEQGYLYISVPTWLDSLNNFGLSGFDLEYYYDPNHVNVWTRETFENMLSRAGLEIVKKDYMIYDSTYLCKRNDNLMSTEVYKLDAKETVKKLATIKKAYSHFASNEYKEAFETYPDYPAAYQAYAEFNRATLYKDKNLIKSFIEVMLKNCPTSVEALVTATDLYMRAEEWELAIKSAETALKYKPENPASLSQLINIMREMALRAQGDAKKHYYSQGLNIGNHLMKVSSQHHRESLDIIYSFASNLPVETE